MSTERVVTPLPENHRKIGLGTQLRNIALTVFTTSHPWGVDHLGIPIYYPPDYHPEDPGMDAFTQPVEQAEQPAIIANRRPRQRRGMLSLPRLAGAAAIATAVAFLPGIMNSKAESPAAAEPAPTPIPVTDVLKPASTPLPTFTATPIEVTTTAPASVPPPPESAKPVEAKQQEEWEEYFELVSADQARAMLEAEKAKGNTNAFLLPQFDLTGITKDFRLEERQTNRRVPMSRILLRGLNPKLTSFYSNHDGEASPAAIGAAPPYTEISGKVNLSTTFVLELPRIAGPNGIALGLFRTPLAPGVPVNIGQKLAGLENGLLPEDAAEGGWQAVFFIRKQDPDGNYNFTGAKLNYALKTPSGKFVMVQPQVK